MMMVVTMPRFLSDGVARRAHRQSDRDDKAFDHGINVPHRDGTRGSPVQQTNGANLRLPRRNSRNFSSLYVRRTKPAAPENMGSQLRLHPDRI